MANNENHDLQQAREKQTETLRELRQVIQQKLCFMRAGMRHR
jgi:hypothetical protein